MNGEDIIRVAREVGWIDYDLAEGRGMRLVMFAERFAALVAAAEREACAKVCEARAEEEVGMAYEGIALDCAAAIRARGCA